MGLATHHSDAPACWRLLTIWQRRDVCRGRVAGRTFGFELWNASWTPKALNSLSPGDGVEGPRSSRSISGSTHLDTGQRLDTAQYHSNGPRSIVQKRHGHYVAIRLGYCPYDVVQ